MATKCLLVLCLLLVGNTIPSMAQRLVVDSFEQRPNDLSASTSPRVDNNGVPCALMKVQIASPDVRFEGTVMGEVAYMTSEYWVYMPKGSKRLTVKLEGYLPLSVQFSDYDIKALESKTTYLLVITGLTKNEVGNSQEESQDIFYPVTFEVEGPRDAVITMDGKELGKAGKYKISEGTHYVAVVHDGYAPYSCRITVDRSFTHRISLLKMILDVNFVIFPHNATVTIDGITERLSSDGTFTKSFVAGSKHYVKVECPNYKTYEEEIVVNNTNVIINMDYDKKAIKQAKKREREVERTNKIHDIWLFQRQTGFLKNYIDYSLISNEKKDLSVGLMYTHCKTHLGWYAFAGADMGLNMSDFSEQGFLNAVAAVNISKFSFSTAFGGAVLRLSSSDDIGKWHSQWMLYGGVGYFEKAPALNVGIMHSFAPGIHLQVGYMINKLGNQGVSFGMSWGWLFVGGLVGMYYYSLQ